MTLREIEHSLPNGFHDSQISNLNIDYIKRTLTLSISIWIGEMVENDTEKEKWKSAKLELVGLQFCVIESPDEKYLFAKQNSISIDMGNPKEDVYLPRNIPKEAFTESFFVSDWNSFIHLSALDANLIWLD